MHWAGRVKLTRKVCCKRATCNVRNEIMRKAMVLDTVKVNLVKNAHYY